MTYNQYLKLFKKHGFYVSREGDEYFISQYTPAGEDWGFYLEHLQDLPKYADNFDKDSEFEMWVEAKRSGVSGVPDYQTLLEDQEWKENTLRELANEF